jgi:hypothetical protein
MWVQILTYLKLQIPTPTTVFRKTHYQYYIKNVISNPQLKTLIEEGVQAYNQQLGSDQLGSYLEKIQEIKTGNSQPEEQYENFLNRYKRSYDFN